MDVMAHPDRLRGLLQDMVELLVEAEVSTRCGASDGELSGQWSTTCQGGRSCGSSRYAYPARNHTPAPISRRRCRAGRPPGFTGGIEGSISSHSASERSAGDPRRPGIAVTPIPKPATFPEGYPACAFQTPSSGASAKSLRPLPEGRSWLPSGLAPSTLIPSERMSMRIPVGRGLPNGLAHFLQARKPLALEGK